MDGIPAVLGHRAFGHAVLGFEVPTYLADCHCGQLPELSDLQSLPLWHWKIFPQAPKYLGITQRLHAEPAQRPAGMARYWASPGASPSRDWKVLWLLYSLLLDTFCHVNERDGLTCFHSDVFIFRILKCIKQQ